MDLIAIVDPLDLLANYRIIRYDENDELKIGKARPSFFLHRTIMDLHPRDPPDSLVFPADAWTRMHTRKLASIVPYPHAGASGDARP